MRAATIIAKGIGRRILLRLRWLLCSQPPSICRQKEPSSLLAVGALVTADFTHRGERIHTLCRVEEQGASSLRLRIISEMGKIPLLGLRARTAGQLAIGLHFLPFQVLKVNLPWVEAATFPEDMHLVQRQSLRIPFSFPVRFRPQGIPGSWLSGTGIDISVDGFCFFSPMLSQSSVALRYEVELKLAFPKGTEEMLALEAQVVWRTETGDGIKVGMKVANPSHQRALTRVISQLQHQLTRHPEDYLMESSSQFSCRPAGWRERSSRSKNSTKSE